MAVSTSSIFHFTPELEYLVSILQGGFRPTYCLEEYYLDDGALEVGIPMVSFCDIPLSQLSDQFDSYGNYGIGLSKSWASTQKINPVIYMDHNSYCSASISAFIQYAQENDEFNDLRNRFQMTSEKEGEVKIEDTYTGERKVRINAMTTLISYIKNSSGDLYRKGELHITDYNFYAEREWRFVPTEDLLNQARTMHHPILMKDEYLDWRGSSSAKQFLEPISLGFDHRDIDYIIVKNSTDIPILIEKIKGMPHLFGDAMEMEVLFTKIISASKIIKDF